MGLRGPGAKGKKQPARRRRRPSWARPGLSRSQRVIAFIQSLKVTSGALAGQKFKLRPWQKEIIEEWYAEKNGRRIVRTGLLSMGRKNGKTALVSALAMAHLLGPECERRGQIVAAASDRDQSGLIFDEILAFIEDNPRFDEECNVKRHEKVIEHLPSGSKFRALSSDAKKSHGLSPSLVLMDELSQWGDGIGRRLYDALVSGSGARKDPLTVVISTQAADDNALLSRLIDYGKQVRSGAIDDVSFSAFVYEVPTDADVWDPNVWPLANPALSDFRSLEDLETIARRAQRMPTEAAAFKNLMLNMRVAAEERWIPEAEWMACVRAEITDEDLLGAGPCFGGLDLGSVRDLTSFALFWPLSGFLRVWSWCPGDALQERMLRDRVPYDVWAERGYIEPTPGRATDKRIVARRLAELCAKYQPQSVAFDRWGMPELERILSEEGIILPLQIWGQGYVAMSPATKAFEEAVLNRRLLHDSNPCLTWAISNVAIESDAAGNKKPNKDRSREKIDPAVASIMAVGLAASQPAEQVFSFEPMVVEF